MGNSHLLDHLFSEEKLANIDELNFQNNKKRIAEGYVAELEQEINANKTPTERAISKGIEALTELNQKRIDIEAEIENRIKHTNNEGQYKKEINSMKNDQREIINMIKEIHEDIQEIKHTTMKQQKITNLEIKRKDYLKIANNYPPLS